MVGGGWKFGVHPWKNPTDSKKTAVKLYRKKMGLPLCGSAEWIKKIIIKCISKSSTHTHKHTHSKQLKIACLIEVYRSL